MTLADRLRHWLNVRITRHLENARRRELARGPREQMHGITVVTYRARAEHARSVLDRVRAALELVARHDPGSLDAMRERFAHVQVVATLGTANAEYRHGERLCVLSGEYVERESTQPARLAMTLVHELTHARHLGRARRVPLSTAQAEWLCIGAELAFIKKVPGTGHLRRAANERLARRADFYERPAQAERLLQYVRSTNVPRWVRWLLLRVLAPGVARVARRSRR